MQLRRVEVDPACSFYILPSGVTAFCPLAHIKQPDTHRNQIIQQMLEALRRAAAQGWFYVNPRDENQVIAYCDAYPKPFWFVLASGDSDGFEHITKDWVVITALGHRDSKFPDAIGDVRGDLPAKVPDDPSLGASHE